MKNTDDNIIIDVRRVRLLVKRLTASVSALECLQREISKIAQSLVAVSSEDLEIVFKDPMVLEVEVAHKRGKNPTRGRRLQ